ncbi:MAG TPA: hypothetical protein VG675_17980 [Bryobacteraceae bacterium]|nr:hypothetical protein [Bryobacteraceae bacterium]
MAEQLYKLTPNRDLQCYFLMPSSVAALSETSDSGFTVSGCWRQQFDWAVVEWNRDNVFEHPALRSLPDGDLSGLQLAYDEVRTNCIPIDSVLFPTVDWPYLRIWIETDGSDTIYQVPILNYATPVGDTYTPASIAFELQGTPTAGDYIELAWLDQHYNYQLTAGDSLATAIAALAGVINTNSASGKVSATANEASIVLTYNGAPGANGNRVGVYGTVHGSATESWNISSGLFSGGVSPQQWHVSLDFGNLTDLNGVHVPTSNVRKLRWTWAADLQVSNFVRSEFSAVITNWQVTGTGRQYSVPGAGSRRIEDNAADYSYSGTWTEGRGNYSGGSIRWTTTPGDSVQCTYSTTTAHSLYLGTRRADSCGQLTIQVDDGAAYVANLTLPGEDMLVRILVGEFEATSRHTVTLTHTGAPGSFVYFDFLEIAVPTLDLPAFDASPVATLATDWDTNHSLALAPERTAWLLNSLGFRGRANHYAGALWFYELARPDQQYASATIQFTGEPEWSQTTELLLGPTSIQHVNLIGDTAESIATCFALLINAGSTGVWAQARGATLTVTARTMGVEGNNITLSVNTNSTQFTAATSGAALSGGVDGKWVTDLAATPGVNRAARDWNRSFFRALQGYGISVAAAFSMELQHGDDSLAAGIAQRYPNGDAVWLNTPSLQTNFGPESTAFWRQVYLDMAGIMTEAGVPPYLQFGEVQWWYFAAASGMPFYDSYTTSTFQTIYGHSMQVITGQNADPSQYPEECMFLPQLVGQFTSAIMDFVRQTYADAKFEVLYPPDVNDTPLNKLINLPTAFWTPTAISCLKTENFTYTGDRDLNKAYDSILLPMQLGFAPAQSSHLVGISEYTTPWEKEQRMAMGEGIESVVLFALDQFCLIGYGLPLSPGSRRSLFMG